MDIEKTLRLACVAPEPGPNFEEAVMARVTAAAWRAAQVRPRKARRIVLIGVLFAGAVAAALLAVRYSIRHPSAVPAAQVAEPATMDMVPLAPPAIAQPTVVVSAPVTPSVPPPPAQGGGDIAQLCSSAAAAPPVAPRYTVLVQPLQFDSSDPVILSRVQEYYAALLESLRRVPGLALAGSEAAAAAGKPADYRITVTGSRSFSGEPGAEVHLWLEAWTGNAFVSRTGTSRKVRSLDINSCPADSPIDCGPARAASIDVVVGLNQLPRYPGGAQLACNNAVQQNLKRQLADPAVSIPMIRQGLQRIAGMTGFMQRSSSWALLRNRAVPELVQPLVAMLHEATDEAFRKEVVTLLAVKFSTDPAAQHALAEVAASEPDTLMRRVAERAVAGETSWRDHAVARVRDTRLPTAQRLDTWYWMVDAMGLDKEKISAELVQALAALREAGGIQVLAGLLADTQKDPGGADYGLDGQQGQWAIRQIGSVRHPAAPELLIACFDAMPNYITLGALGTRRDDARVVSRLEAIAADQSDARLSRQAAGYLLQPAAPQATPAGN
jgi:hypothetical protein